VQRRALPYIAVTVAALGFLMAAQLRSTATGVQPTTQLARQQDFSVLLDQLDQQAAQGRAQVRTLKADVAQLEAAQAGQDAGLRTLQAELNHERAGAGLTPVSGAGVDIRLDDGRPPTQGYVFPGTPPWIIHDGDLRDIVNAMWNAGASAVSINGQRMVATSSVRCAGTIVQINNAVRLSTPYHVLALGPVDRLLAAANAVIASPGEQYRMTTYGTQITALTHDRLDLPGYDGAFALKWTQQGP
jgi:uncharacterized protein YlxW (UPF0749 family)